MEEPKELNKYCVNSKGNKDIRSEPIFLNSKVRQSKDHALKSRLRTLILSRGTSEPDFYNSLGISKQVWYALSWGIWECSLEWKVKIAKALDTDSSVIFFKGGENERTN